MRKLATVKNVDEISPIPGADAIECAHVGGWKVVVKKGEFEAGDDAIFLEIDSWVPAALAPFLCKDKREYNGVPGARLRTVKLRGQVSQGLLLPLSADVSGSYATTDDLSDVLGIQKWEAPVSAQLSGMMRGTFPSFIKKTDQERIQNLDGYLSEWVGDDSLWEITEKLDGSSMTIYLNGDAFGVCSRNIDLLPEESNSFWRMATKLGMEERLRGIGRNIAVQGELVGASIQGNKYGLADQEFYVFDIFDIDTFSYLPADERQKFCVDQGWKHCPVIAHVVTLHGSVDDHLKAAEGKSALNEKTEREGLVFKCINNPDLSFKAISNKFLLEEK